jgi:secretion/DNA translocation related TadE-like protein
MSERGSATVVVLGMVVALTMVSVIAMGLSMQVVVSHHLQSATDRAALAAGDVLLGRRGEYPCDVARDILRISGFEMVSCELEESSARVIGRSRAYGLSMTRRAHAGVANSGQK